MGFAGDYVKAMWLMLQQEQPEDYVIATGETHKVREFVELAFKYVDIQIKWVGANEDEVGLDAKTGKVIVKVNPNFYRPAEVELLLGDPTKARKELGWKLDITFDELVNRMISNDLELVKKEMQQLCVDEVAASQN
ncbi:GDP-mannose 4,6-dehydratase [compost metagenome]